MDSSNFPTTSENSSKENKIEISKLLALGESSKAASSSTFGESSKSKTKCAKKTKKVKQQVLPDSDSDWEEVEEIQQTNESGLNIYVKLPPNPINDKKNKYDEFEILLRRKLNKIKKKNQLNLHKTNILCWIAHMNYINPILNDIQLYSDVLKLIPSKSCYPTDKTNKKYFQQICKWYNTKISLKNHNLLYPNVKIRSLKSSLSAQIKQKSAICRRDYIFIFVILARAIGLQCRIVYNFVTAPIRPSNNELWSINPENIKGESINKNKSESVAKPKELINSGQLVDKKAKDEKLKPTNTVQITGKGLKMQHVDNHELNKLKSASTSKILQSKFTKQQSEISNMTNVNKSAIKTKAIINNNVNSIKKSKIDDLKEIRKSKEITTLAALGKKRTNSLRNDSLNLNHPSKKIKISNELNKNLPLNNDEKIIPKKKTTACDYWIEIYSEENNKWIAIDVFKSKVDSIEDLCRSATHPISYVFAWNNDNTLKDVSARYCTQWNTITRKFRVDQNWINGAIHKFLGIKTERDKKEDLELHKMNLNDPIPTVISEFKDHPLYALRRYLLKFEEIYPPDALVFGYVHKEPIYSRDCVYTLHSREMWLKQARVVKLGEKPYKIVTARPKFDRLTKNIIKGQPLEIFGIWQTQEYVPPTAENGIVPRNSYGSVELFKPCMLPKKTVHLQFNELNRVCKKLKIDCAPAIVGFDYRDGSSYPVYDGFVICEEFAETVTNAWLKEQEELDQKEKDAYQERVYGNWKKLIKSLLLREKLKIKYKFGNI